MTGAPAAGPSCPRPREVARRPFPVPAGLRFLLPAGLLANLAFMAWRTDVRHWAQLQVPDPGWLALAAGLAFLPWFLGAVRIWNWLRCLGPRVPLGECFRIVLWAELGAAVSPTALGGSPVKAYLLGRHANPGAAIGITALGTLEDACFNLVGVPVILALTGTWRPMLSLGLSFPVADSLRGAGAILGFLILGGWVWRRWIRGSNTGRHLDGWLTRAGRDLRSNWRLGRSRGCRTFLINALLAAPQWTARYAILAALVRGFGLTGGDPLLLMSLQWVCLAIGTLVPTPGAAAGAEAAFLFLYEPVLPPGSAIIVMTVWRITTFYLLNLTALLLLFGLPHVRPLLRWMARPQPGTGR